MDRQLRPEERISRLGDGSAHSEPGLNRRRFMAGLVLSGAAASAALLAACGNANVSNNATNTASVRNTPVTGVSSTANAAASVGSTTRGTGSAPTSAQQPAGNPVKGGTLTIAETTDVDSFDPFYQVENNFTTMRGFTDTLVRYNEKLDPQPELAESWQLAPDAKSITLKLRQGVKFHSGREMTADDVLFSLKHVQDKATGSQLIDLFQPITGATATDKNTVTFTFNQPYVAVFDALDAFFVLDSTAATDLKKQPAGSGPFILADRTPGDRVVLKRFDGYWKQGQPYLDQVIHRAIPDEASLVASLKAGEVDLVWKPPLQQFQQLKSQSGIKTDPGLIGVSGVDIAMNVTKKPFDDKRVRQAINWATDRAQWVKTILYDASPISDLPFPPYSTGYFDDLALQYTYNLDKAKQLLADAGYSSGLKIAAITSGQQWPTSVALAQILQASLAQIGVQLTLQNLDPAAFYDRDHASTFDMMFHVYGRANKEPVTLFGGAIVWRPKNNVTLFSLPQYTDLIARANAELDGAKRKDLYRQIDQIILDDCWTISAGFQPQPWAMRQRVQNFAFDRQGIPLLDQMWIGQ
ncbi:MAG: hypothetical protein DLM70_10925 [Chloroflexi bacterium]|nr:MAG: hypothetical protein DLM70_10925 [Chloroflexota bacterium]